VSQTRLRVEPLPWVAVRRFAPIMARLGFGTKWVLR